MLVAEERIKTDLENKFPILAGKVEVKRERRIFTEVPEKNFRAVFDFAVKELGFDTLYTITGLDLQDAFAASYHLGIQGGIALTIRSVFSHESPTIKTISDRFPAADIYERELVDLFGFKVEGLPEGNRYPLPDNWPRGEYPLRKDWKGAVPADKEAK